MSKVYATKYPKQVKKSSTTPAMRELVKRPGKTDNEGNLIYMTEQAHKDRCDVNKIMAKYDKGGLITHISKFEGEFGDMTGIEFKAAMDKITAAKTSFEGLPSKIRKEFDNNPSKLLQFMDDPANRQKAIDLGLINNQWTEATDGLGEHVPQGGNVNKPPKPQPSPETPTT